MWCGLPPYALLGAVLLSMAPAVAASADERIGRSGRPAGTQGGYGLEVFSSEGSYCVGPPPHTSRGPGQYGSARRAWAAVE